MDLPCRFTSCDNRGPVKVHPGLRLITVGRSVSTSGSLRSFGDASRSGFGGKLAGFIVVYGVVLRVARRATV